MQMAEIEFGTREGTKEWKRRERKTKDQVFSFSFEVSLRDNYIYLTGYGKDG